MPSVHCVFPGYEDQPGGGLVEGSYIDQYHISCTTLPLRISAVGIYENAIIQREIYTIVKIQMFMLGYKHVYDFFFLYMHDVQVYEFIPQNVYFFPDQTSRRVNVRGQHFLPVANNLICRVSFPGQIAEFVGVFINNHTIGCDIPPPPLSMPLPTILNLTVSFNSG